MSRAFFIVNSILIFLIPLIGSTFATGEETEGKSIVITSQTLTVDNKSKVAIFEGSVVAKSDDITIQADKMTVFYDKTHSKITKIHALGNVRVYKKERAIFSNEAIYSGEEERIVFTGHPKAVEGENVITGEQIIYFLKDDRAVVEKSKVVLRSKARKK